MKISFIPCVFIFIATGASASDVEIRNIDAAQSQEAWAGRQDVQSKKMDEALKRSDPKLFTTYDWIKYEWVYCEADWNQRCQGTLPIVVPAGWQACRSLGTVTSNVGGGYRWTPTSWYTNDPESPDRYRAYDLYVTAAGSGNVFDQTGGNIRIEQVGIRLIPAAATNADRYAAGCEMPSHD